jgi:hypothetical protein
MTPDRSSQLSFLPEAEVRVFYSRGPYPGGSYTAITELGLRGWGATPDEAIDDLVGELLAASATDSDVVSASAPDHLLAAARRMAPDALRRWLQDRARDPVIDETPLALKAPTDRAVPPICERSGRLPDIGFDLDFGP